MTAGLPASLVREGLALLAGVGGPLFAAVLAVGLMVGVAQAATQVNDPAVGFLPRAAAAIAVCWIGGGWMLERLSAFLGLAIARMAGG